MPWVEFELMIPVVQRAKTYTVALAAINNQWIERDLEGSGRGLPVLPGRTGQIKSFSVSTEIRIEHLPNTGLDSYNNVNLLAGTLIDLLLFWLRD
jgi:hypothetical protein